MDERSKMATIYSGSPSFFSKVGDSVTEASGGVVGYEGSPRRTRIARYAFSTSANWASGLSIDFGSITLAEYSSGYSLPSIYISTSATDYPSVGTPSHGNVYLQSGRAKAKISDFELLPNTTYYIYIYPSSGVYAWWYWNTGIATLSLDGEIIPNALRFTLEDDSAKSILEATIGDPICIVATPPDKNYTCKLECSLSGENGTSPLWAGQSTTYDSPSLSLTGGHLDIVDLISSFITVTGGASATVSVVCKIFNSSGEQVGAATSATCLLKVPTIGAYYETYFKPSVSIVCESLTENEKVKEWEKSGIYVAGYSKLKVTPSYANNTNDTTASFKSVVLSCGSDTHDITGNTQDSYEFILSAKSAPHLIVTNSRGIKVEADCGIESSSVKAYSSPTLKVSAYGRCTSDFEGVVTGDDAYTPVANGDKAYICIDDISYSRIGDKNVCSVQILCDGNNETSEGEFTATGGSFVYVTSSGLSDDRHEITVTVTDSIGGTAQAIIIIPRCTASVHIKQGGLAVAVGMDATNTEDGVFDVGFKARFNSGILPVKINTTNVLSDASALDEYTNPNYYVGHDGEIGDYHLRVSQMGVGDSPTIIQELRYWENGNIVSLTRLGSGGVWAETFDSTVGNGGIYKYIRKPNRQAVCWGTYSIENVACDSDISGWFRTDAISLPSFPSGVFLDVPVINLNYNSTHPTGNGAMIWHFAGKSKYSPGSIYLIRPSSTIELTGDIDICAIGSWR